MKVDKKDLLLYAVTDRHWLNGGTLCTAVKGRCVDSRNINRNVFLSVGI